jgi:hypothetical protein
LSAKLPACPCKHSGTSWGLESAESLPAGDLEMGQIKGMHNEGGGTEADSHSRVCRTGEDRQRGLWKWRNMEGRRGFNVSQHHTPPKWPKAVMFIYFFHLKTDFFVPSQSPTASPKPIIHSPLKSSQLAA